MQANTPVRQLLAAKPNQIHTVAPDTSVFEALERMARHDIGALVVVQEGDVVGMFSERDYARKVILQGRASRETRVRDIMTSEVLTVEPSRTTGDCMQLMTDRRVRHLPVLEDGRLVGLVSIGDVVKAVMAEQVFMIEQLESYIRGTV